MAEALLVLASIVFVHECGHFYAARLQNIYVKKFAIGFGPELIKYEVSRYSLGFKYSWVIAISRRSPISRRLERRTRKHGVAEPLATWLSASDRTLFARYDLQDITPALRRPSLHTIARLSANPHAAPPLVHRRFRQGLAAGSS